MMGGNMGVPLIGEPYGFRLAASHPRRIHGGGLMSMLIEAVRYKVTNGRTTEVRQFQLVGPTAELAKQVAWAAQIDRSDGWYVVNGSVEFGTIQNGAFLERKPRKIPLIAFDGYRRMASFLRA